MVWCDVAQAALWAGIALVLPPLPVLLVLVFCAATLATIFAPAGRSALPTLVEGTDLPAANALLGIGINAGLALGPAASGALLTWLDVRSVLLLNALTFMASATLLRRVPPLPPAAKEGDDSTTLFASTRTGLHYIARHATARAVSIGLFLIVVFGALDNVALVALAQNTLSAGDVGYGVLASVYGVGMIVGPLALLRWSEHSDPAIILLWGTALLGVGGVLTGIAPAFAVAVLAQSVAGVGNGLENIGTDTLIQRTVPREMLGRVFGTVGSGAFLASSLAYILGGPLLDRTSPRAVFVIAGSGVLVALLAVWRLLPAHHTH